MLRQQLVELGEMPCLLIVHVLHQGSEMRVGLRDGRRLSSVDQRRRKLASMIHTQG